MKLSQFAQKSGVTYRTAWTWWRDGKLRGEVLPSGAIRVEGFLNQPAEKAISTPAPDPTALAMTIVMG